jgi:hypothetical protein
VSTTWQVLANGGYRRLTLNEDLISEGKSLIEDAQEAGEALRAARDESIQISGEARALIKRARRDRRLRTTKLRLVPTSD